MDANGYPQLIGPGMIYPFVPGSNRRAIHLIARAQNLSNLARILGGNFSHPIVDKTGLNGLYDFTLEFAIGSLDPAQATPRKSPRPPFQTQFRNNSALSWNPLKSL
jgi:uncharacterized protein (TIGR03435 family)